MCLYEHTDYSTFKSNICNGKRPTIKGSTFIKHTFKVEVVNHVKHLGLNIDFNLMTATRNSPFS